MVKYLKFYKCKKIHWAFIINLINNNKELLFRKRKLGTNEFYKHLKSCNRYYKIIVYKNKLAGFYSIINKEITIILHKDYHGLGIGTKVLKHVDSLNIEYLEARIKAENVASINLFKKAGYKIESINMMKVNKN